MSRPGKATGEQSHGHTLIVLSVLLLGSAVLRTGLEAAPAIAREVSVPAKSTEAEDQVSEGPRVERLKAMLVAFQQRDLALKAREVEIEDRMKALSVVEAAIDRKLEELVATEERLRATLAIADGASEGDLARLTGVYEKMKTRDASALFEEMAPEFAAGFLARMKPDRAAGILAGMNPQVAYTISVVLAGRNANAPAE